MDGAVLLDRHGSKSVKPIDKSRIYRFFWNIALNWMHVWLETMIGILDEDTYSFDEIEFAYGYS